MINSSATMSELYAIERIILGDINGYYVEILPPTSANDPMVINNDLDVNGHLDVSDGLQVSGGMFALPFGADVNEIT
ncbi:MAG: hypothetical protein R3207_02750, partial [Oceanospirillum sp.]|nr:hypothetical protein [Oceanospirillum sp.]